MNDKRACEYLLVPYLIWQLADNKDDLRCKRIRSYIELFALKLIPEEKKRFKLSKRVFGTVRAILEFISTDGLYSGHKVVLMSYYLTQLIFDSKEGVVISEQHIKAIKKVYFIVDYVLAQESKDRDNRLSDEEFELLNKSARKQAKKVYENYFLKI